MIDLVCVNYRTPEDLEIFCESVVAADISVPTRLLIENVDPTDRDIEVADRSGFTSYVHLENVGYARACNHAASVTDGEYVAFFNADTRLAPQVIERVLEVFEEDDLVAVAGPRQVDHRNRITHAGIVGTLKQPRHRAWRQPDAMEFGDVRQVVSVSGSAYFVRRTAWRRMERCDLFRKVAPEAEGAFLPTQHYYEETWFSYHVQSHGYKVMYVGSARMTHLWHRASPVGGPVEREMLISQAFFREACQVHGIECD